MRIRLLLALLLAALTSPLHAARPNIVMVLIHDMGRGDFSCFGNKQVETPNIDRMAKEGIRFTQFYVASPIFSPSRCGAQTSRISPCLASLHATGWSLSNRSGRHPGLDGPVPTHTRAG